jgi:hypothetical protein
LFLLQLTVQGDRFLLYNLPLGVATLPGPVVGRRDDDDDDAGSVSSQSSASSDVAGPSNSRPKKKKAAKQVMMVMIIFFRRNLPRFDICSLVPTYLLQAYFWG